MTHDDLIIIGAKWLSKHHDGIEFSDNCYRYSHPLVLKEMSSNNFTIPDIVGFCSEYSTLIECKISKQDYLSDWNKTHRYSLKHVGNYRYYLTPQNLIDLSELYDGWGLLETDGNCIYVKSTSPLHYEPEIKVAEYNILYSFATRKKDTLIKYLHN